VKYTKIGSITVCCSTFSEPEGLRDGQHTTVEIVVADTGCGMQSDKLEHIFRELEQVESSDQKATGEAGVGLGLAVVARILKQSGGQLRVDSKVNGGSRFSFLFPLTLPLEGDAKSDLMSFGRSDNSPSGSSQSSKIDNLVDALTSNHITDVSGNSSLEDGNRNFIEDVVRPFNLPRPRGSSPVILEDHWAAHVKANKDDLHMTITRRLKSPESMIQPPVSHTNVSNDVDAIRLRILIVEDDKINRVILAKRLRLDGHTVVNTTNGQEGLDTVISDRSFDVILMDIQYGFLFFESRENFRLL